jgi:hypothetical protein
MGVTFFVDDVADECLIISGFGFSFIGGLSDEEMAACVGEIVLTSDVLGIPGC